MVFRIERGILFVDESGQMRPPRVEGEVEIGVVTGLLVPDRDVDRDAVRDLVAELRQRVHGRSDHPDAVKGKLLDAGAYDRIASEVRARWVVGYPSVRITKATIGEF